MKLSFARLARRATSAREPVDAEIEGWLVSFGAEAPPRYYALVDSQPCCVGCLPRDASRRIEIFAQEELQPSGARVRLRGKLQELAEDGSGWRFQLREATLVGQQRAQPLAFGRRGFVAGPLACVALGAGSALAQTGGNVAQARAAIADIATVDIHSHAGNVIGMRRVRERQGFAPLAAPMREGGMAVVCLAMVADTPTHHVTEGRIRPFREPNPGELAEFGQLSFQRLHEMAKAQGLAIITTGSALAAARSTRPAIIITSEGADFLEGQIGRLAEAHGKWSLRHLQLTHYRPNELGDIQTEPAVRGGLTDFGAEVIRQCNRLGIVVDVAHGTIELVRRAASVTSKPLILSHTSLTGRPVAWTRLITSEHAKIIAGTGGVIGIWPPSTIFADMAAMATGIARMVDVVGVDHVGLGSDMEGLVGGSTFPAYTALPDLSAALLARGFQVADVRKLLGGNYQRVFMQTVGG